MLALLLSPGEVLAILIITAVVVFLLARCRKHWPSPGSNNLCAGDVQFNAYNTIAARKSKGAHTICIGP